MGERGVVAVGRRVWGLYVGYWRVALSEGAERDDGADRWWVDRFSWRRRVFGVDREDSGRDALGADEEAFWLGFLTVDEGLACAGHVGDGGVLAVVVGDDESALHENLPRLAQDDDRLLDLEQGEKG